MLTMNVGGVVGDSIGDAKINELNLALDQNEICWLQVRVYNLLFMDNLYRLQNL